MTSGVFGQAGGRRPSSRIRALAVLIVATSCLTSSEASADLGTASLVIGLAEQFLSLGQKQVDPALEGIQYQIKMLNSVNLQLDAIQSNTEVIIDQLSKMPDIINANMLDVVNEEQRRNVISNIVEVRKLGVDLEDSRRKGDGRGANDVMRRLRDRVDTLNVSNTNLMDRNNDALISTIVAAMLTEVLALKVLPPIGNELSNTLQRYDGRLSTVDDMTVPGSLASIRRNLRARQSDVERDLASALNAGAERVQAGEWPWYSHTLVKNHDVQTGWFYPPCHGRTGDLCDMEPRPVFQPRPYDDHTSVVSRKVSLDYLTPDRSIYTISVARSAPAVRPGGAAGAMQHTDGDGPFEARYEAAHDISLRVATFNNYSKALVSIDALEGTASAARALVANWNDAAARALAASSGAASSDVLPGLIAGIRSLGLDDEARTKVAASVAVREAAAASNDDARRTYEEAIRRGEDNRWTADVMSFLTLAKLSVETLEVGQRLGLIREPLAEVKPQPGKSVGVPPSGGDAGSAKTPAPDAKRPVAGREVATVPKLASVGLTDLEKEQTVETIIADLRRRPIDPTMPLPPQATTAEIKIDYAFTLLNSMAETLSDRQVKDYNDTINASFSVDPLAVAKGLLISKPTAGGLLDAPNRIELRRQVQELAAPFARKRRDMAVSR